jgi:glycosyltransferase involved in cell wall biosynthesis
VIVTVETASHAHSASHPPGADRIALVHDWLTGMRGGEKCLKVLCELLPDTDLFTLLHVKGTVDPVIEARVPRTSFLQAFPGVGRYYRYLLPLFPLAAEGFDLDAYPLIVSVSHCAAKGVLPGPASHHICYCLTPMRYVWDQYPFYFGKGGRSSAPRSLTRLAAHYLRMWDVAASHRVDAFVAVSGFVADRIRKYYRRQARVIYPPVEWSRFEVAPSPEKDYYLLVSANAPYKRLDIVLEAFRGLDRRLKIVGHAPAAERAKARQLGLKHIEWLGWRPDEELRDLYAHCRALLFPGTEDFGLVPVEVQAAGRPVIAYGRGGALESVHGVTAREARSADPKSWQRGLTGLFFHEPTGKALTEAIECFESVEDRFDPARIREWARQFDASVFVDNWKRLLSFRCQTQTG